MSLERLTRLGERLHALVAQPPSTCGPRWTAGPELGRELFESMLLARHADVVAHELRATGAGHYTICSSGHEGNVVLGRLTLTSDPALLHYRSAAVQLERARAAGVDGLRDIVLSLVASREEPTSGGRHKVFGSAQLGIIPQTSTIASHLPRAIGLGFALGHRERLGLPRRAPAEALVVASFGDASLNHSTALGALNAASWTAHQCLPMPVLFVCEDNGLGISVRTPEGWVESRLRSLPGIEYFEAPGWELETAWQQAARAVAHVRATRRPAVLHLRCVRLLGHAGSDADTAYRSPAELADAERRDPVACAALTLLASGAMSADDVTELNARVRARARAEAERACTTPKLATAAEVMSTLCAPIDERVASEARRAVSARRGAPATLAQGINAALAEALERYPHTLIFGEDVAKKGGVYGITKGLLARAGSARVFNTLLDEQTILGLGLGAATLGLLPIPEIQYLAYLHNAEDQLRGEAATMRFFSNGAYDNPMVVRIAGLAYQKGFGGHFHNDHSLAVLRDVPGLMLAVPARADDAIELYRTALALAEVARRVVVMVEPIALYHQRDLFEAGDEGWLTPLGDAAAATARARVYDPAASDLVIVSYGNGVRLSLRAARQLRHAHGVSARVLDLRWLSPLPREDVVAHARATGRVLVVDECRISGSVSEAIAAMLLDERLPVSWARVAAADSFVPLGEAAELVLVQEGDIVAAALRLASDARWNRVGVDAS
jgi:2-oxoisovalerate dehydrogenase E1 component